jgi:hypothetical protein
VGDRALLKWVYAHSSEIKRPTNTLAYFVTGHEKMFSPDGDVLVGLLEVVDPGVKVSNPFSFATLTPNC